MENTEDKVVIVSNDQVKIEFRSEANKFSPDIIGEAQAGEDIPTDLPASSIMFVKEFLEAHDYNMENIKITRPLKSDKLEDHLDPITYNLFKKYFGVEHAEELKPIVDASYYFNIELLKQACLITLGCPFYVGTSEQEKQNYKEKWGIGELTPEEEREIIDENKPVFDQINSLFEARMEEEQKKFEESMKQDQEQQQQDR